jgi:Domain of unknown function (DUF4160)
VPTIAILNGIAIVFYYRDHEPPHFHVEAPDFSGRFDLTEMTLIEVQGRVRSRDAWLIRDWAVRHRPELLETWSRARRNLLLGKITD